MMCMCCCDRLLMNVSICGNGVCMDKMCALVHGLLNCLVVIRLLSSRSLVVLYGSLLGCVWLVGRRCD